MAEQHTESDDGFNPERLREIFKAGRLPFSAFSDIENEQRRRPISYRISDLGEMALGESAIEDASQAPTPEEQVEE